MCGGGGEWIERGQWGTAGGEIAMALNSRACVKVHGQSARASRRHRLRICRGPGSV